MSSQLSAIWDHTLVLLEKEVSEVGYKTWFEPIVPISLNANSIDLSVRQEFVKNHIEQNFVNLIKNAIQVVTHKDYSINILLDDGIAGAENTNEENIQYTTLLNSKYTFDTFVIGNSNKLAHAASVAVAESIGKAYNPLFLYGGAGLGKTHLMHAIGNYVLKQRPHTNVLYVPTEKFTNELINAIRDDKNNEFRSWYRSVDLLLLDDVQFISRKERTQEEFFYTFNTLYDADKQIVIASDKKPGDIPLLDERLRTRFEWGLTADVQEPDFETRVAILRKKAWLQDLIVPEEIIAYIAEIIPSNIRLLEGALNRVVAYASLTDYDLTRAIAEEALKNIISGGESREITQDVIIDAICKFFDLRDDDFVSSKKRSNEIVYPRQIAMYLCRELLGMSLPSIGTLFGKKNHTTVMHAIKKVNEEILTSGETKRLIENLISDIKGPVF
ncbi:MAG: chromosomal replication initiator protein DnaA [Oscillospiraceae bacterium]|nr:chromosomal replication initiator protein DnaA [Oscillospiraceae bacterium]